MELDGQGWARKVLGPTGPTIRSSIPGLLQEVHASRATLNGLDDTDTNHVYGLMWLAVPRALVDAFGNYPSRSWKPRHSPYRVALVNDIPLISWRYAKTKNLGVREAPFGPLSDSRRAAFLGDGQLTLDGEQAGARSGLLPSEEIPENAQRLADTVAESPSRVAAVIPYASTPGGLFHVHLGYAELNDRDELDWLFLEELSTGIPAPRSSPVDERRSFDSGQITSPVLRPRNRGSAS